MTLDPTQLNSLITELQQELKSDGKAISFSYDAATGMLVGMQGSVKVVEISFTATQGRDGHNLDIDMSITQYLPLDHQGNNQSGLVTKNGEEISINLPLQAKDTDGDWLDNPVNVTAVIKDGPLPEIIQIDAAQVAESALDGGTSVHQARSLAVTVKRPLAKFKSTAAVTESQVSGLMSMPLTKATRAN